MPRRTRSRESKKKGKGEWESALARSQIPPNWGRSESETPLPSPWARLEELELRSAIPSPEASSSSRGTGPRQKAASVWHSAMYSDRPRRPWHNRGGRAQQTASSGIQEEDSGKASSNELGPTVSDTSKFETLSLNDSPPALDSTDGSEKRSTADRLLDEPTFDSMDDVMDYLYECEKAARAARYKALSLSQQSALDKYEAQQALLRLNQAQSVPAQEQASAVAAQGRHEGSKEKIAENGNKWMCEEVRVAFQNYLQQEDLKEFEYEFEELKHQCFHVENYCKIFHHFNFTVKMKKPGSSEWTSRLYFAEVKEILRKEIYFCCPLEQDENGNCYACKNQRMEKLQHPMIGAFDRGSPDTVFPFTYGTDSSDDDDDGPVYDEAWRMRMRAAGIMVG